MNCQCPDIWESQGGQKMHRPDCPLPRELTWPANDGTVLDHRHSDDGSNHRRGYHNIQERFVLHGCMTRSQVDKFIADFKVRMSSMWFSSKVEENVDRDWTVDITHGYDSGD
jgi:hypothetical protein